MIVRKAAIIGLGKIGMGFDYNSIDQLMILTHATAYQRHRDFKLVCGVDRDCDKRIAFTKKFGLPAYANVKELYDNHKPDVISICVPTNSHFSVFNEIIVHRPLAIICEKPFSDSSNKARIMLKKARAVNCVLIVNYMRRFEPGVLQLKKLIDSGKLGEVCKGVVWYSKGLLNNGSHLLDLLRYFLGDVQKIKIISKGRKWDGKDPEPDFVIFFKKAEVCFLAAREESFTSLNLELMLTKGKIQYVDVAGGNVIRYWLAQEDKIYSGYKFLNDKYVLINNNLKRYQWYVMNNLARYFRGKANVLYSSGETALATLQVMEKIMNMRRKE